MIRDIMIKNKDAIMGRTGITYSDVSNAIATIQGNQKNPTVDSIREELGTGSRSTIAKYFSEWKTKNGVKNTTDNGIPNELQNLIQALWGKIQSDADQKIEAHQIESDAQILQAKNALAQIQQQNSLLHVDIQSLNEKLTAKTVLTETTINALHDQKNQNVQLQQRIIDQDFHLDALKKEKEALHQHLKQTQDNLMHYQQAIEKQRQEQQLQLEKERATYEIKISQLQNELQHISIERESIKSELDHLKQSHETLKAEFHDQKKELAVKSQDNAVLLHEKNHLKNSHENLQNQYQALFQQYDEKNNDYIALQIQLKTSENRNELMKLTVVKLEENIKALQFEHHTLLQEKIILQTKLKADSIIT